MSTTLPNCTSSAGTSSLGVTTKSADADAERAPPPRASAAWASAARVLPLLAAANPSDAASWRAARPGSGPGFATASRGERRSVRARRIVSRDADEASGGQTTDMTSLGTAKFWGLSHAQDTPRRN